MCDKCGNPEHVEFELDLEQELAELRLKLENLIDLSECVPEMVKKDQDFAVSLLQNYTTRGSLTNNQWVWVDRLRERVRGVEPIYGSFDPILVMFRLAGAHGLKKPKVRLMSKGGTYVQLNFYPGEKDEKVVDVYIDGWQGHGHRKFAGWIHKDRLVPYSKDRMTEDVRNVIQDLALDPIGTAKAMAGKLGVCMYCGQRLSDDRSKKAGYGPICAGNWGLPWGDSEKTNHRGVDDCYNDLKRFYGLHPFDGSGNVNRMNPGFLGKVCEKYSEAVINQAQQRINEEKI